MTDGESTNNDRPALPEHVYERENEMKQQPWPSFLVTRHSLPAERRFAVRRAPVKAAKQEFPRVAILTRRRPLPKGH
jgi:hypothetical protein